MWLALIALAVGYFWPEVPRWLVARLTQ